MRNAEGRQVSTSHSLRDSTVIKNKFVPKTDKNKQKL